MSLSSSLSAMTIVPIVDSRRTANNYLLIAIFESSPSLDFVLDSCGFKGTFSMLPVGRDSMSSSGGGVSMR